MSSAHSNSLWWYGINASWTCTYMRAPSMLNNKYRSGAPDAAIHTSFWGEVLLFSARKSKITFGTYYNSMTFKKLCTGLYILYKHIMATPGYIVHNSMQWRAKILTCFFALGQASSDAQPSQMMHHSICTQITLCLVHRNPI